MKKIFYLFFIYIFFILNKIAFCQNSSDQKLMIGKIDSDHSEMMSIVTIRLDKAPAWKKLFLEEHGDFIQLSLPQTFASEPGSFIDGSGPYIAKIVAFQVGEDKSIIRIFTKEKASALIKAAEVDILDNRIAITLDHKSAASFLKKEPDTDHLMEKNITAVSKQSEHLEEILKKEIEKPSTPLDEKDHSKSLFYFIKPIHLQIFALCCALFIILIFSFLTIKRMKKNKRFALRNSQTIGMSELAHLDLSSKQKIAIIEIGTERFLISVSSSTVSFLTKLESKDQEKNSSKKDTSIQMKVSSDEYQKRIEKIKQQASKAAEDKKIIATTKTSTIEQKPNTTHTSLNRKKATSAYTNQLAVETSEDEIKDVTQMIREKLKSLPKI